MLFLDDSLMEVNALMLNNILIITCTPVGLTTYASPSLQRAKINEKTCVNVIEGDFMASVLDRWLEKSDKIRHETGRGHTGAGVSFRDLNCYGFMSSDKYQSTLVTWILAVSRPLLRLISGRRSWPQRVEILHGINGLVRPGETLLVLGRPGSGCSTLLKTLAGDNYGFHVDDNGINYQGTSYRAMQRKHKGECIYIAEMDVNFPELTVDQTIAFAASTRAIGLENDSRGMTSSNGPRPSRDVASLFHLEQAFNTRVGNATIRGISGGEKRRTSLAEAFVGCQQFQCFDNSIKGLDSSTALSFITLLRSSAERLHSVVLMSIYQTSEAQYKNFDQVMLLYEGRQIYFGPTALAADYFKDVGFEKPSHLPTADFLTSLTNPAERVIREGYQGRVPRTPEEFAVTWRQSKQAKGILQEICDFEAAHPLLKPYEAGARTSSTTRMMISIHLQILVCLRRGIQRLRNNYIPVVAGILANSILALVMGSAFYNLPQTADSMDKRAVLLFFSLIINACTPAFERPIVEKHDRYAYYYPFTEGVTSMLCDLPNKLATSILFNLTLYFMTNLRRTVPAFFYILYVQLYRAANYVYVFPHGWIRVPEDGADNGAVVNRGPPVFCFRDRSFRCLSTVPAGPAYSSTTNMEGKICPIIGAIPGESVVHGSAYLAEKYSYVSSHIWRNLPIAFALMVFFCAVHLLATQYIAAERSKGDILIFRRRTAVTLEGRGFVLDKESNSALSMKFAQDINKLQHQDNHDDSDNGTSTMTIQTIPKQSTVFHWNNLCYDVKTKDGTKRILDNVNGWVKPGTLTALMGVSGAGKTTFLDVLANRATFGTASGEIFVGQSPRDSSFQRRVGYVQQEDLHPPAATVRETLELSALLRQSGPETELEKLGYVNTVLDILDMEPYADAVVGVPGEGLNIEQRKRLSIGVELVAKPELLLFLDEPTSGLDSQTAWSICTLLRKLADHGQAVLCTIHQPSSQIFQMFDRLLLLNRKGQTLYFGDIGLHASAVIDYFDRNGAPTYQVASANPAEWMLDVTSGRDNPDEWRTKFDSSEESREMLRHQVELISTSHNTMIEGDGETRRFGSILEGSNVHNVQNGFVCRTLNNRTLYESREGRSKSYSWVVFLSVNILVELFWQTLAAVLVFVAWYYPTGLWRNSDSTFGWIERGALVFILVWLFCLWISTFSQAVAAGIEHVETSVQVATLFFWLSLVFSGVLVQPNALPRFWIFVYRLSPLTYFINGMVLAGLKGTYLHCSAAQLFYINPPPNSSTSSTCGEYLAPYIQLAGGYLEDPAATSDCRYCPVFETDAALRDILGMDTQNPWRNAGYMAVYVVFNTLVVFVVYWLARVPKKKTGVSA
ncbi:hypothetical protein G7Y89_g13953 [Cudoniella acicularis]|uniref:ABC transporter domain-containing protein n=1 Tax=Cudoniella acicularis TaxID=354080 RepID=A0A8H4VVI4_9HELO|nr:hypothetical protein G7Y89_g13953 [Cudoniella acicularis]